jgi:DNA-binding CsgD family transcriptional regulator
MLRDPVHDEQNIERIIRSLGSGMVLVDAQGEIRWIDQTTRRWVDGQLRRLELPLRRDENALNCFISTVEIPINGQLRTLSVVQAIEPDESSHRNLHNVINAAVNDVLSDASWLARPLSEKLRAWCQVRQPVGHDHELETLTPRERQILGLICESRSDADMSDILKLSQNTVRNHVASIFRKIGVNRRSAAVVWARERGITCRDE